MSQSLPNMSIRIDPELRDLITIAARSDAVSRNEWVVSVLRDQVSNTRRRQRIAASNLTRLINETLRLRLLMSRFLEAHYSPDELAHLDEDIEKQVARLKFKMGLGDD